MSRAVDLGCHEGYPGHHVYNMLLERILARGRNWVEFTSIRFIRRRASSPKGSANYGIELAFPGNERAAFERDMLYPLAGLSSAARMPMPRSRRAMRQLSRRPLHHRQRLHRRPHHPRPGDRARPSATAWCRAPRAEQVGRLHRALSRLCDQLRPRPGDGPRRDRSAPGPTPAARWAAMWWILSGPTIPANLGVPAG